MENEIGAQPIALLYIGLYLALMALAGWFATRWSKNASDFLIGGRSFGWLLQGIGLSSLIIAGTSVSVAPALGYNIGLLGHWWTTGWVLAILFGAFVVAPLFRKSGAYTLPEWIGARYGERARLVASVAFGIALIFSPLANILGGGLVLAAFTGWEPWITITGIGMVVAIYLYVGGLYASMVTSVVQWAIALFAFVFILPWFLFTNYGGPSYLEALPDSYFTVTSSEKFPLFSSGVLSVFGMFWLMGCIYFGGPTWNRAASARTASDARKGWLFAAVVSIPVAFVLPLVGMYVKASGVELDEASGAFGLVIAQMHPALAAIFSVGVIAATMSTAELGIIGGSTILLRDIYQRYFRPDATLQQLMVPARIFTFGYALIGGVFGAYAFYLINPVYASLYGLALFAGFAAAGIPPLLGSIIWPDAKKEGAFFGLLFGTVAALAAVVLPAITWHAMYVGFVVSLVLFVTCSLAVKVTGPWWHEKPISVHDIDPKASRNFKLTPSVVTEGE